MIASAEEFVHLRESDDPDEYERAAHEQASTEVWLDVIARYPTMRFWVAQNKTIPISILEILAKDPDPNVRGMVAAKLKLSPELQRVLAADPDEGVRDFLAHNAKATMEALETIANGQPGSAARSAAARLGR